ncbi:unnamed protein product [Effrenium voratum]|nr:unnamed protein product [Effrenium voratum]
MALVWRPSTASSQMLGSPTAAPIKFWPCCAPSVCRAIPRLPRHQDRCLERRLGDRCRWFEDLGLDNKMPVWAVRLQGMRAAETCVTMLLDHSSTCAWIARRQVSFLSSMREQRKCVYSIR